MMLLILTVQISVKQVVRRSVEGQYSWSLNGYKIAFTSDETGTVTRIDFYTIVE